MKHEVPSPIALAKRELRAQLRARLKKISPSCQEEYSDRACQLLAKQRVWKEAKSVLFFAPLPDEINLLPMLNQALAGGRVVALPRFSAETGAYEACQITDFARDCVPGKFGIFEPGGRCPQIPLNRLDLALVSGVGFGADGYRLGRGKGHYDRMLALMTGTKCGVAFDEQMEPTIPTEPHDIRLNCILTPTQWLDIPFDALPMP